MSIKENKKGLSNFRCKNMDYFNNKCKHQENMYLYLNKMIVKLY